MALSDDASTAESTRIPRLTTARLLLREPRPADFEAFFENAANPLARFHIGGPLSRRDAWLRFMAMAGHWLLQGLGWWTVEERTHGAVGAVGVFQRETGPSVEIGWAIYRDHWGKGYATEAARAALDFAVTKRGARRVIAHIAKLNHASAAVATKIGMRCEGEADFYGEADLLYAFNA